MLKQGKAFNGSVENKDALQTPLHFTKTRGGGYRNESLMFVHYNRDKSISIIKF